MLKLRAFGPSDGLVSQSPFSIKAIGYLHLLDLDWQLDLKADIRKQPFGKFPVLVDGDTIVPDSGAIASYLEAKIGRSLNDGLSAADKALSHALIRMAEEHTYFIAVHNRWSNDQNFEIMRPSLAKIAPFPMSKILPGIIRKGVNKSVAGQGIGRMSDAVRLDRFNADLDAVAHQLGTKQWLFGDQPRAADLSVAPMLATVLACPAPTTIRQALSARTDLVDYAQRAMRDALPSVDALPYP